MLSSLSFAGISLLVYIASAAPTERARALAPRTAASTLTSTDNYLNVVRVKGSHSAAARHWSARPKLSSGSGDVVPLSDIDVEEEWAVTITFGGEEVLVILDTGSSDTWLAKKGFQCVTADLMDTSEENCYFGPLYNGTFTEGEIEDANFNITYGDGEFLTGTFGYTDITIGNITVTDQQVALVSEAYWEGDGMTSGLMGLAYSALTSEYVGDNPTIDNDDVQGTAPGDQEPYSPVVQTMITQGLDPALFTLALERSSDLNYNVPGGFIAFGGLPPVSGTTGSFVATPILIHEYYEYPTLDASVRSFYSILPDGYVYENSAGQLETYSTSYDGIVDSGTTLLYVPTSVVDGYLSSFHPAPVYDEGYYYYPCDATAPYFGMKIAGETFEISSEDIILPDSGFEYDGVEYCLIGVVDGGSGEATFPVFGDVFLKNVVAVFDVGASTLNFAQHTY